MAGLPWLKVYSDLPRDPRSLILGDILGDPRAWTYVVQFRMYLAENAPTGCVSGPHASTVLEVGSGWPGRRGVLVAALVASGFVVVSENGISDVDWDAADPRRDATRRRITAKPEALEWYRANPGVPMPEGFDPGAPVVRLLTPEEQAAKRAEHEEQARIYRAEAEERRRLKARRWVYFMQERGNSTAPVKIGVSRDVERRRGELQRAEGIILSVLATMEGTVRDEQAFHARFSVHRLHGEWFSPAPEILAQVAVLNGVKE